VEEADEERAEDREVEGVEVSEAEVVVDLIIEAAVVEEEEVVVEEEEVGEVSEEVEVDGIDRSLTFSFVLNGKKIKMLTTDEAYHPYWVLNSNYAFYKFGIKTEKCIIVKELKILK
jgi:hypothetical protein